MPTTEQLRSRLLKKLKEFFQLDQPDLDFGFYRIMHAKSAEVLEFIDKDLLRIVAAAFGEVDDSRRSELQIAYDKAIQTAKEFGAPEPENTDAVRKAQAALDAVKDSAGSEADIYDHLYRFFERYYDDGDFISRRYYTRETSGKAAPFAIPYNGEEVKLHWANADQYYVKTAEYFSNFTFDLKQTAEVRNMSQHERVLAMIPDHPVKVHFRVVDASEGEHGNVKASEQSKRFFIIHGEQPLACTDDGELVVNFEYRSDPEKSGQEGSWRDKRNAEATAVILTSLHDLAKEDSRFQTHLRLLQTPAPTEKDVKRPLLAKYVNQYTARNTMDYFIHKDLGGFLRRELDFYIKNEVMQLDDIENADAPAVESYLGKIRVLRRIAGKLIDFLAQLEEFQKKLWLKKKFIVETNYCITLDRVPEELYPEVAANEAQCEEWIKLFAIDEIKADLHNPGFSRPLTTEFLKANNKLMLDTRFFDEGFKARLVASIETFDEQCDGLLIHSENFQALRFLRERFTNEVDVVFIDPPYNTGLGDFIYKDTYQRSSWLSLMHDRLIEASALLHDKSSTWITVDENEAGNCKTFGQQIGKSYFFISDVAWEKVYSPRMDAKQFSASYDHILVFAGNESWAPNHRSIEPDLSQFPHVDEDGRKYRSDPLRKWGKNSLRTDRPNLWYPISSPDGQQIWPIKPDGTEGCWRWQESTVLARHSELDWLNKGNGLQPYLRQYADNSDTRPVETLWSWELAGSTHESQEELKSIFPRNGFSTPKPTKLVSNVLSASLCRYNSIIDYFAGSGTTGHAAINLNREDNGSRKYILVEMADYFDTVLKPRIAKVVYSDRWKDGKPTTRNTSISHCFKYLRLESYEDTLNNLRFNDNPARGKAVASNASLKEDYMLRYLLDVETRGSQSLLNIDAFADPMAYKLLVKKPGSDEVVTRPVDLLETFNYLIGLRVLHIAAPQEFIAEFFRIDDPEVPKDQKTKLVVGKIIRINEQPAINNEPSPLFWFRKVEGWVPKDPINPNNGQQEKVLIVWRKLTGDLEQDNLMLDEWFQKNRISPRDFEFDTIYVNGSNNLPNLKLAGETWKVRLIEEEFLKCMWDVEGV